MKLRFFPYLDYAVLVAALAVLTAYTYALFIALPYFGFEQIDQDGTIQLVFQDQPGGVRLGDRVLSVDGQGLDAFRQDQRRTLWGQLAPGETITLEVERAGQPLTVTQTAQPLVVAEFEQRLLSQWFLAWFFWLAGLVVALLVRPRDLRWRLLIAFSAVTALWLSASTLSRWHLWESAIVLRAAIWASVPISLHLHLRFPTPLAARRRWIWIGLYGGTAVLIALEALQLVDQNAFALGMLIGLGSVLVIWVWRAVRREPIPGLGLLLIAAIAALLPVLAFGVIGSAAPTTLTGAALGLLALPILPLAYVYMAARRQLGGLELWANRAIAGYLYAMAVMFLGALVAALSWGAAPDGATLLAGAVLVIGLSALVTPFAFPPFQRLIERRLLGLPLDPARMLENYTAQIVAATDLSALVHTLRQRVLPSLLVRQSALYRFSEAGEAALVYATDLTGADLPTAEALAAWRSGRAEGAGWVRLPLPLIVDGDPIGLLLLGAHDPDDVYTNSERATLRAIADQTAIALAHAIRTEQLRLLFQANIERHEAERGALARDLHDAILQQMAVLAGHALSPAGEQAYDAIVSQTRQMISGLRPVMLDYGLAGALEQLADDLAERTGPVPDLRVTLDGNHRYSSLVEQHVYRIVQQAAENALKHARAAVIEITGRLEAETLTVHVLDDGVGLPGDVTTHLGALVAQRHFGLAGMLERAQLIGAGLNIQPRPTAGTAVTVRWPR